MMTNANRINFFGTAVAICALLLVATQAKAQSPLLPEAKPTLKVVVRLLADDTYQVGKAAVKASQLTLALRVLAGLTEKPAITVRPDEGVSYDRVVKIVEACREADLTEIAFMGPADAKVP